MGSNYDYHFIWAGRRIWKIIWLSTRNHWKIHRNRKRLKKLIQNYKKNCILQFIDNARFTASSLSNLDKYLSKGFYKIKCKSSHNDRKCETCGIIYEEGTVFFNTQTLEMIYMNTNIYNVTQITNKTLMKSYRNNFLIHTNFVTMQPWQQ